MRRAWARRILVREREDPGRSLLHVLHGGFVGFDQAGRAGFAELVLVDRSIFVRIDHGWSGMFGNPIATLALAISPLPT